MYTYAEYHRGRNKFSVGSGTRIHIQGGKMYYRKKVIYVPVRRGRGRRSGRRGYRRRRY